MKNNLKKSQLAVVALILGFILQGCLLSGYYLKRVNNTDVAEIPAGSKIFKKAGPSGSWEVIIDFQGGLKPKLDKGWNETSPEEIRFLLDNIQKKYRIKNEEGGAEGTFFSTEEERRGPGEGELISYRQFIDDDEKYSLIKNVKTIEENDGGKGGGDGDDKGGGDGGKGGGDGGKGGGDGGKGGGDGGKGGGDGKKPGGKPGGKF